MPKKLTSKITPLLIILVLLSSLTLAYSDTDSEEGIIFEIEKVSWWKSLFTFVEQSVYSTSVEQNVITKEDRLEVNFFLSTVNENVDKFKIQFAFTIPSMQYVPIMANFYTFNSNTALEKGRSGYTGTITILSSTLTELYNELDDMGQPCNIKVGVIGRLIVHTPSGWIEEPYGTGLSIETFYFKCEDPELDCEEGWMFEDYFPYCDGNLVFQKWQFATCETKNMVKEACNINEYCEDGFCYEKEDEEPITTWIFKDGECTEIPGISGYGSLAECEEQTEQKTYYDIVDNQCQTVDYEAFTSLPECQEILDSQPECKKDDDCLEGYECVDFKCKEIVIDDEDEAPPTNGDDEDEAPPTPPDETTIYIIVGAVFLMLIFVIIYIRRN